MVDYAMLQEIIVEKWVILGQYQQLIIFKVFLSSYLTRETFLGLIFTSLLSILSIYISQLEYIRYLKLSSLTISIIIGCIIGNTVYMVFSKHILKGVMLSQKQILRIGIILYGFRITFHQIIDVGLTALIYDVCVVSGVLVFGYYFGTKLLKMDKKLSLMISSGAAICGAAAVLAVESSINPKKHETSISIATVVLFGSIAMLLFPYLADVFSNNDKSIGIALGATVHEVAQVVAAGSMFNEEVTAVAVIVKLTRVMLLIPVLLLIIYIFRFDLSDNQESKSSINYKKVFPWFVLGFVFAIMINSIIVLPSLAINYINQVDNFCLTIAMGALGLETRIDKLKSLGLSPFILGGIIMVMLILFLLIFTLI